MSKTVYVLLCWVTFIPTMIALSAGVFWIRDTYGLPVIGPMGLAVFIGGLLLHRWELKNGSLLYPKEGLGSVESSSSTDQSEPPYPRG